MIGSRRISVVFAIPALDRGGPDRVIFEILSRLDRERFAPSVLVSEETGHYLSQLPADVPVEVVAGRSRLGRRYPVWEALRSVRRRAPDVVVATQRMILTMGIGSPGFPKETRLLVRQANDVSADFGALVQQSLVKHRLARTLALTTLRRADSVVCQSDSMRDDLRGLLGDEARLHVIWNPIDVERTTQRASEHSASVPGRPALISVGRLARQKGFDLLLPALAVVRERWPDLHLTIYGDGPDRAALTAQASSLGLGSSVTFAGFSPNPLPAVRESDLFVLASRYEGFPNAALEALACGTPVVLTNCPGANADIVRPGVNGRLAGDPSPQAIARALEDALDELPSFDAGRIQADCRDRFSAPRIVEAYERVIESVAQRGRS